MLEKLRNKSRLFLEGRITIEEYRQQVVMLIVKSTELSALADLLTSEHT